MDSLLQELAVIDAVKEIRCDYQKSLALLRALKAGAVSLDSVTMTDSGWTVTKAVPLPPDGPPGAPPAAPNGEAPAVPIAPATPAAE